MDEIKMDNYKFYKLTIKKAKKMMLSSIYNEIFNRKSRIGQPEFEILMEDGGCIKGKIQKTVSSKGCKLRFLGRNINLHIGSFLYIGDISIYDLMNYVDGGA